MDVKKKKVIRKKQSKGKSKVDGNLKSIHSGKFGGRNEKRNSGKKSERKPKLKSNLTNFQPSVDTEQKSVISLAKFEKRLKRKHKKNQGDEPSNSESTKNYSEPSKTKRMKIQSSYNRCSPDELLKFWTNYVEDNLATIEADQFEFKKDFISASNGDNENSAQFLKNSLHGWKEFLENKTSGTAAPYILFFCSSAVRAVNLSREITNFKTEKCRTAKLFAKHIKLEEQKKYLASHVIHMGIGTPQRVRVLLEENAMKTTNLHYLVFDWAHVDEKKRRLFDLPYIRKEIFDLVRKHFSSLFDAGTLKIVLL